MCRPVMTTEGLFEWIHNGCLSSRSPTTGSLPSVNDVRNTDRIRKYHFSRSGRGGCRCALLINFIFGPSVYRWTGRLYSKSKEWLWPGCRTWCRRWSRQDQWQSEWNPTKSNQRHFRASARRNQIRRERRRRRSWRSTSKGNIWRVVSSRPEHFQSRAFKASESRSTDQ